MTSPDDLSPAAQQLLFNARRADDALSTEVEASVQRFREARSSHTQQRRGRGFGSWNRYTARFAKAAAPWATIAAILSGTLAAYALVGPKVGLPVPAWWIVEHDEPDQTNPAVEQPKSFSPQTQRPLPTGDVPPPPKLAPAGVNIAPITPVAGAPAAHGLQSAARKAQIGASSAGDLTIETALISEARDAFKAADYATARRHLQQHLGRFPQGVLSAERQALLAMCQCRAGFGTSKAKALVAAHGSAFLARRVALECGLDVPQ